MKSPPKSLARGQALLRQQQKHGAIPRPPRDLILSTPVHLIAFGFGAGLARRAPGTWGTLVALPIWLPLSLLSWPYYLAACALLFVFGCWVCGESSRLLRVEDYPGLVFDEIVGFLIAAAPLQFFFPYLGTAPLIWLPAVFLLFRLFDIAKPWPIGWIDGQVHGGFGVMLDDVVAGVMAAAVLILMLVIVT